MVFSGHSLYRLYSPLYSGPVQEKAVILKQKVRKSLKTPDETVTVNFVPQQSNVKQSFPVTHAQLLKDDDLSSPGEWD